MDKFERMFLAMIGAVTLAAFGIVAYRETHPSPPTVYCKGHVQQIMLTGWGGPDEVLCKDGTTEPYVGN